MEPYKKEIIALLKANRKIEAIKVFRTVTNASLKDAKECIDFIASSSDFEQAFEALPILSPHQENISLNLEQPMEQRSVPHLEVPPNRGKKKFFTVLVIIVLLFFIYWFFSNK